ncbi:hypothetical protein N657DRAFT_225863 [Parathielavia appendiculata]|uniref:Uncharacterized protein n=1 Tax=Parathielavia appendiculata TaxID=2587402 RepID=A0AAN6U7L8_9PEZI|nr:hypothetical protein N657DRAFT_225863 [Parathielavia appendiculata]
MSLFFFSHALWRWLAWPGLALNLLGSLYLHIACIISFWQMQDRGESMGVLRLSPAGSGLCMYHSRSGSEATPRMCVFSAPFFPFLWRLCSCQCARQWAAS